MSFSLRRILPVAAAVSSAFAIMAYYFYVIFKKQQEAIINAGDRLKKNFNNYEVYNYIHKIAMLKKIDTSRSTVNSLMEAYVLIASSDEIDIGLKVKLRTLLKSNGINVK